MADHVQQVADLLTRAQWMPWSTTCLALVEEAVRLADADPHPPLADRFNDILAEKYPYQPK